MELLTKVYPQVRMNTFISRPRFSISRQYHSWGVGGGKGEGGGWGG